jgi:arsenite methyltransferase
MLMKIDLLEEKMEKTIESTVREKYAAIAVGGSCSDNSGANAVARAFGYSPAELASIPSEASMGLSCGNPTATAHLRPGEVVVDLGSGGGLDVFLAAKKVGPTGRAIGIDMTPEMVERARRGAMKQGFDNVEFHLSTIDKLPLADASIDCVISNCVINLAPDKSAVFREIYRVLKPGGRVAVSDIALKKDLPPEIGNDLMAYVGCIAGAVLIDDYIRQLKDAGFQAVEVIDTRKDLNAYSNVEGQAGCSAPSSQGIGLQLPVIDEGGCCVPAADDVHGGLAELLRRYDINEFAASVQVYALKAI